MEKKILMRKRKLTEEERAFAKDFLKRKEDVFFAIYDIVERAILKRKELYFRFLKAKAEVEKTKEQYHRVDPQKMYKGEKERCLKKGLNEKECEKKARQIERLLRQHKRTLMEAHEREAYTVDGREEMKALIESVKKEVREKRLAPEEETNKIVDIILKKIFYVDFEHEFLF